MIPAGSGNTERHIQMIEDYGTTVLVATPSYAMHICEVGEKMGYDWEKSPLRVGLFGGEPCPPGLKAEIERRMHIVCTDNYGLTEVMGPGVSGECLAERYQQHIAEDHFLWEVIDPETGEPVGEGEMGELVLTPLCKQGIPVLRYRTHDLTAVHTEPCACGRTLARMDKVRSRSDDMLIIRGTNVFPSQIEDVLTGIEEVTPHYHIIVETRGGMDALIVETELRPEAFRDSFEAMDALRARIAEKLKGTLLVAPEVRLVEPGGIERAIGKANNGKLPLDLTERCVKVELVEEDPCEQYTDLDANAWYAESVHFALVNGLFVGFGDGTFRPEAALSRAMVATVLYRQAGSPAVTGTSTFPDLKDDWYADAVAWAQEAKVVIGDDKGLFRPDDDVTREEMVTMLYRFAASQNMDTTTTGDLSSFTDASSVQSYATEPMTWAVGNGIILGMGNNELAPRESATRAQFAAITARLAALK